MGEVLLTVLTNNTSEEWAVVWDEDADAGKRSHVVVSGTGNVVVAGGESYELVVMN